MKKMRNLSVLLSIIVVVFVMSSCKKETTTSTSTYPYAIRMTDAPAAYNAVYIDIEGVEITGNDGNLVMMNMNPGIYNLLDFANGVDTLLCTGTLNNATVNQIRLILGPNNSVVVDNVSHPLSTPSAEQSGLKLQVHQTLQAGVVYNVLLDFDANKSIVMEGNGTYKLKPVIRTVETAISGAIKGKISPIGTLAFITATSPTLVTYSSNITLSGDFMLIGLPFGFYSVTITPAVPLNPVTINNITVTTGITTDLGTIIL